MAFYVVGTHELSRYADVVEPFRKDLKIFFTLLQLFDLLRLHEVQTLFMRMRALNDNLPIDLINEIVSEVASHDPIIASCLVDNVEIVQVVIKKNLFLGKRLIVGIN